MQTGGSSLDTLEKDDRLACRLEASSLDALEKDSRLACRLEASSLDVLEQDNRPAWRLQACSFDVKCDIVFRGLIVRLAVSEQGKLENRASNSLADAHDNKDGLGMIPIAEIPSILN